MNHLDPRLEQVTFEVPYSQVQALVAHVMNANVDLDVSREQIDHTPKDPLQYELIDRTIGYDPNLVDVLEIDGVPVIAISNERFSEHARSIYGKSDSGTRVGSILLKFMDLKPELHEYVVKDPETGRFALRADMAETLANKFSSGELKARYMAGSNLEFFIRYVEDMRSSNIDPEDKI